MKFLPTLLFSYLFFGLFNIRGHNCGIINEPSAFIGDSVLAFVCAKILAEKYNIPLYYQPFNCSHFFSLDNNEKKINNQVFEKTISVQKESDILAHRNKNVLFKINTVAKIKSDADITIIKILKNDIKLKNPPALPPISTNLTTVAVHIRKGNRKNRYDGELSSKQQFIYNRKVVTCFIRKESPIFPVDFLENVNYGHYEKEVFAIHNQPIIINPTQIKINPKSSYSSDVAPDRYWSDKFPPEQFYIDQIIRLSEKLGDKQLYVHIFTDDKNPNLLLSKMKTAVNKSNVKFNHIDTKYNLIQDLYFMSKFDVLIRSQSNFSRTAQLMGNHRLVIYPIKWQWVGNKLIVTQVAIEGDITNLKPR